LQSDDEEIDSKSIPLEATEACREIGPFVNSAAVSAVLAVDDDAVKYVNVCTREGTRLCIEVSEQGFRVVAMQFDAVDATLRNVNRIYETSHALMQAVSPAYQCEFGNELSRRLEEIADKESESENESETVSNAAIKTQLPATKTQLPEPLSARFTASFAYRTVQDRIPTMLTRTIDSLCRRKREFADVIDKLKLMIGALSQFRQELQTNKVLTPFAKTNANARDAQLIDVWNASLADYSAQHAEPARYFVASWLFVECYVYRRINVHRMNV
jgi:hypothetical protein